MIKILPFLLYLSLVDSACHHKPPSSDEVVLGVPVEQVSRSKRAVDKPMRIHITYDQTLQELTSQKRELVENVVLPKAVDYWQKTLQVKSEAKVLKLLRQCKTTYVTYRNDQSHHYCLEGCRSDTKCGEVTVPVDHLMACRTCANSQICRIEGTDGPGVVDTDFILYVSTKTSERCGLGTTVAYAAYCQLEQQLDRPIAGYVNICPESISTETHDLQQVIATIKHEVLHALGFSAGLFAFYRDDDGSPLTPRKHASNKPEYNDQLQLYQWSDRVVKTVTRPDWMVKTTKIQKKVHMIVTPRVVREVRNHFNCQSLEGAELEDQGIIGTALTHWEKRVFEHEAMTGTYTQNPVISRVTLALMEDTGWYSADYTMAEDLDWGKNLGCDFVKKSCMEWMEGKRKRGKSLHPFCDRPRNDNGLRTECSTDLQAVALCNLVEYTKPLPVKFQYMTAVEGLKEGFDKYGGSVELADFCPYIQEFAWKEEGRVVRNSDCGSVLRPGVKTQNYALEKYGNTSVCLVHADRWTLRRCSRYHELDHWGSGCYRYRCDSAGLTVLVDQEEYVCSYQGQVIRIKQNTDQFQHRGAIYCPDCVQVCGEPCKQENVDANLVRTVEELGIPCAARRQVAPLAFLLITWLLTVKHL